MSSGLPQIIPSFPDLNLVGGISYDVQTTNDTPTLLFGHNMEDASAILFKARIQFLATDLSLEGGFQRNIVMTRNGATLSKGIPHDPLTDNISNPAIIAYWNVSGTQAQLLVKGVVGKTINWTGAVSFQKVSV